MRTVLKFRGEIKMGYNTPAKKTVADFFASNPDKQFSAEQVIENIRARGEKVPGNSTVYRIISAMTEGGELARFRTDDAGYLFQYIGPSCDCENHFHMKCVHCGRIYHLECEKSEELVEHMLSDHGFRINSGMSVLYGTCGACAEAGRR